MLEIGTSGSMSGEGKRGVAAWPKLPRHISTYMKARLSRGVSAVFGDLDSSCFRIGGSGQAPQPRSGAPKA